MMRWVTDRFQCTTPLRGVGAALPHGFRNRKRKDCVSVCRSLRVLSDPHTFMGNSVAAQLMKNFVVFVETESVATLFTKSCHGTLS
jgi:hypothetical protein